MPRLQPGDLVELRDRGRSVMNEGTEPPLGEVVDLAPHRTAAYGREPGATVRWIGGTEAGVVPGELQIRRRSSLRRVAVADVKRRLARASIAFRKKADGEYRVNFRGGREDTAYYTNTLADAFETGRTMAKEGRKYRALKKDRSPGRVVTAATGRCTSTRTRW